MKKELHLEKLPYPKDSLAPIMSEDTIKYHRDKLAAGYVSKFNSGEGDPDFNEAGAFLHNIFFPQLKPSSGRNLPYGASLNIIESKYKTFDEFKKQMKDVAMKIQGSGWVYMSNSGEIKTIKNHQIKSDIVLLIDWWEHAWALDYQSDKGKYFDNIWKIINWDVINSRLAVISKKSNILSLLKIANELDKKGLFEEANIVDSLLKKVASVSGYIAAFIGDNQKDVIKTWWKENVGEKLLDKEYIHHITLKYAPTIEELNDAKLGEKVSFKIIGYKSNDSCQAVVISGNDIENKVGINTGNKILHITISTSKDTKPAYSNTLLAEGYNEVNGPTIETTIGFSNHKEIIYDKEVLVSKDNAK